MDIKTLNVNPINRTKWCMYGVKHINDEAIVKKFSECSTIFVKRTTAKQSPLKM